MKIKYLAISVFYVLWLATPAIAADYGNAIESLSFKIASMSAAVKSESLQQEAQVENMKANNRLPDPQVEFETLWSKGATKLSGSVTQEFELPLAYKLRDRVAASSLKALDFRREAMLREKALDAKLLIIDYVYQMRRLEAYAVIKQNLDSIANATERGYRGGEMTILDVRKIKIEQANLMRSVAEAQITAAETAGRINALADAASDNQDFVAELNAIRDYPSESLQSLDYYEEMAMRNNPAMKLNSALTALARDKVQVAAVERRPTFGLGYAFEREEGRMFNGFKVSMTLPFWKGTSRLKAAQLEVSNAQLLEESSVVAERASIRSLYKAAATVGESLAERQEALGELSGNNSWPTLLGKALAAGRISMLEYLNEINYFLTARLDLEEARHTQALLLTQLTHKSRPFIVLGAGLSSCSTK